MKSIERRFQSVEGTPGWSTLTRFTVAVSGQGFSKDRIGRYFNKLVDPEDYHEDAEIKKELLGWLEKHTFEGFGVMSNLGPSQKDAEAYVKQRGVGDLKGLVFRI
jgi:hypothetical protein